MKYKWLNQRVNKGVSDRLIIFFNGWGMDECVVKHLDPEDYDILMFYDYNSLDTDFNFDLLDTYTEKSLVAWSMGVMVATLFQQANAKNNTAINGTLKPVDTEFGIHPKIYDLTIRGFDEKGRKRFIDSMFNGESTPHPIPLSKEREICEQHSELIALKNYQADETFKYNKVLISDNDKIIPTKSQVAFWGIEPNLKSGHCPFFNFTKWSELL